MLGKKKDKNCFLGKMQTIMTAAQHGTWVNTRREKKIILGLYADK